MLADRSTMPPLAVSMLHERFRMLADRPPDTARTIAPLDSIAPPSFTMAP